MQIIDLGVADNPNYSYKYKIKIPTNNLTSLNKIQEWADDIKLDCVVGGHAVYFKTQRDCTLFMLKWA